MVGVAHFTHQEEVRGRHADGIVGPDGQPPWVMEKWKPGPKNVRGIPTFPPPRRRLRVLSPIPQANLQFSPSFLTHTFQSRQADTMWVGSTNLLIPLRTTPASSKMFFTPIPQDIATPPARGAPLDPSALEAALRRHLRGEVRFDSGSRALYATDGSNYRQVPLGVVFPHDKEDVLAPLPPSRHHL